MNPGNPAISRTRVRATQITALFVLGFGTLFSTGCDKKAEGDANALSGKVTLENKPVAGSVVFIGADNKESLPALINSEGKYSIADLAPGDYKVVVRGTGGAVAAPKGASAPDAGAGGGGVAPPAKYGNPATSGLSVKRTAGKQEFNIPLTP